VEDANFGRRSAERSEQSEVDGPASDPIILIPLSATPWQIPAPRYRQRKPASKTLKAYPIGFFHIDLVEVQTAECTLYLYVGVGLISKFSFVALVAKANTAMACATPVAV
jgi:hypothetical protein